jgi:septum formation protein
MKLSKELILGSKSPRRSQFLKELGLEFTTISIDVNEDAPEDLGPEETAAFVSNLKAKTLAPLLQEGQLGLTSDTEVWHEGVRFGKAHSLEDARRMLNKLSGNKHQVVSCFTLLSNKEIIEKHVSVVDVRFAQIPQWAIDHYIANYKPFDKAGAYGIQEWIGLAFIEEISGNYNSVVGLDTAALTRALAPYIVS